MSAVRWLLCDQMDPGRVGQRVARWPLIEPDVRISRIRLSRKTESNAIAAIGELD
jgi:hypothetical protein